MSAYYHSKYGNPNLRKKKRNTLRNFLIVSTILILAGAAAFYYVFLMPNVASGEKANRFALIPTNSNFDTVKNRLYTNGNILNRATFEMVSKLLSYDANVKPGRYELTNGMNNLTLVRKLRSGNQTPLNLTFNNVRTPSDLAKRISEQIEADSASLIGVFRDSAYLNTLDLTPGSLFTTMIPNTYEFYWTTDAKAFMERMKKEGDKFWSPARETRLKELGFTRQQAVTLASIVEKETNRNDEKRRMAGVYINRLNKGWPLEADPTLVFAHADFEIKRVLARHKAIDSPYNTYRYRGLPPGPIYLPSISSIDAVLNYEKNDYMFFCAKEDFSGYHSFASTLAEHNRNAARYQQALNERMIYQ